MPIIETQRDDIRNLKGLHLYHFAASNCSQRVRMALEEKQLQWTGHHIDLSKNEHITDAFQALNPKGVVPVLVHDGKTITESNDIITYIDQEFEGPPLRPTGAGDKEFLTEALQRSSDIQAALKLVSFEFLFKPARRLTPDQLEAYAATVKNRDLVNFMREFSSEKGFSDQKIKEHVREIVSACSFLEDRLNSSRWLNGEAFGLADISWIVNIYRLNKMAFPLIQYPGLSDWLRRVSRRVSFKRAIAKYESTAMTCFFSLYTWLRKMKGTGISNYL